MYIKLLGLLLGLVLVVSMGSILFNECQNGSEGLTELKEGKLILYQGNSIRASVIPAWFKPQVYGSLIDCLYDEESQICRTQKRDKCIGKDGERGCLQFMPNTFQQYCVDKYKLRNDIWDCELQRLCADLMMQDNWNTIYLWTTHKFCL